MRAARRRATEAAATAPVAAPRAGASLLQKLYGTIARLALFVAHDQRRKEATVMLLKTMTSLAFAAACLTAAAAVSGTSAEAATRATRTAYVQTPRQNIIQSERYSRLVATDPAFRRQRMRIECGPISDPTLHQQCIESFRQGVQAWRSGQTQAYYRAALSGGGPYYGSSTAPVNYPTSAGQ
jgi:hypothetical protein